MNVKPKKEVKYCSHCGTKLSASNKTSLCKICYPKFGMKGKNNPFYGKHHNNTTRQILKEKCKIATKKMWLDDEYRKKVINNATGIKRSSAFKEKQSLHAKKQFENKEQRQIRSARMRQTWQEGKITANNIIIQNHSKQEKNFLTELASRTAYIIQQKQILSFKQDDGTKKYFYPDGIIEEKKIIIEYNGDFWHANPNKYQASDTIHHGQTAQEIWERDAFKQRAYQKLGYTVIVVWQTDYLHTKEETIEKVLKIINSK